VIVRERIPVLKVGWFRWFLWLALLRAGTGLPARVGPASGAPLDALQVQLLDVRRQLFDLRAQLP
jgi:hypothetical protein